MKLRQPGQQGVMCELLWTVSFPRFRCLAELVKTDINGVMVRRILKS
jgi:hypothetical protein